jgi:hypothetical protein
MNGLLRSANVALHLTAPMERTVAPLEIHDLLGAVPPSAAHDVATVHPHGGVVAEAAVRALYAQLGVLLAEAGRHLVIHQILNSGGFVLGVERVQLETVLVLTAVLALAVDAVARDGVRFGVLRQPVSVRVVAVVARVGGGDVGGAVEAVLQEVADHAERGQPHPAGLDGARAGHAVAFALLAHLGLHVLKKKEKIESKPKSEERK